MKKEQLIRKIEDVAIAVVPEVGEDLEKEWNVYLVNLRESALESVIVSIKGYGTIDDKEKVTEVFRYILGDIPALSFAKIEPIKEELFQLHNEYWVSFWSDGEMYDKKYVFEENTIHDGNLEVVPLMDKKGVVVR